MKKLIYMCLAVCFFTTIATAQKVTQKDLQGTWKMAAFSGSGIKIDVATEKVTVDPAIEAQLTPEQKQEMELGMMQALEMFKTSTAHIDGNKLKQTLGPQEENGTFTMKEEGGKQYLVVSSATGGPAVDVSVAIINKQLHLGMGSGEETATFVYNKQ